MSLDPPPLYMYEIQNLPLQAITCYQIKLPKMKQSCKPCTSNDTKHNLRKQWSYVFAIVSQKISTHDRSYALLMPQQIVLTKKKIIDFTLLNCKQYCWFEFLFVHASYVFFWNVSWWSQITCYINLYEFYDRGVTDMATLLWMFWDNISKFSLHFIHCFVISKIVLHRLPTFYFVFKEYIATLTTQCLNKQKLHT